MELVGVVEIQRVLIIACIRTSPRIDDELIERGTTFTGASTTFPRTYVAHLSLFTGLYPNTLPPEGSEPSAPIPQRVEDSLRALGYL